MSNTGQLINREALLGRNLPLLGCYSSEADQDRSAAYNFWLGFEKARAMIAQMIHDEPAVDAEKVTRCRDCQHCRLLNDGVSFECTSWEMDFYAPEYSAATYFCADAKPREGAASA